MIAIAFMWIWGCSSSTDPGGDGTVEITFVPELQGLQTNLAGDLNFAVNVTPSAGAQYTWTWSGVEVSNAATYRFVPETPGTDTLKVHAQAGQVSEHYYWVVQVQSDPSLFPGPVPGIEVRHGPLPGDVQVVWLQILNPSFPIDHYEVACSFTGEVTAENWEDAIHLPDVPAGAPQYAETYTEDDHGMIPGAEVWFAVRGVDQKAQVSGVSLVPSHEISTGWWIEGNITDDSGTPLVGVIMRVVGNSGYNDNSDGNGDYRIGPFRSVDAIRIYTLSANQPIGNSWYDFTSDPLTMASGSNYDIKLITRHGLDPACTLHQNEFMDYLQTMTRTKEVSGSPERSILWTWDQYPLGVFLPDSTNGFGLDLKALGQQAVDLWNTTMGVTYFEAALDSASAQVVFRYGTDQPGFFGRVKMLAPLGDVGRVKPEQMEVYMKADMSIPGAFAGVALHELGHVLGLYTHTSCVDSEYLMIDGGGPGSLDLADPVHPDEARAVRAIRYLGPGVDMRGFDANR